MYCSAPGLMRPAELLELQSLSPGGEKVTKSCISQRANVGYKTKQFELDSGTRFCLGTTEQEVHPDSKKVIWQ